MGILAAIAIPMMANSVSYFRLSGDARSVSNAIAVAKMRAASNFSRTRLYVDLSANRFRIETWQKTGTPDWTTTVGSVTLESRDRFGFGSVGTPPPNTQTTIAHAPPCVDKDSHDVEGTACVVFNSRGTPVDSTGAPTAIDAVYLTDDAAVYAVTVSATGMTRLWRTRIASTPLWTLQ